MFISSRDWNAKARKSRIPGVKGKFGLKGKIKQIELTEFCQENLLI